MPSKVLSTHDGVLDYFIRTENGTRMVAAPWLTDTHGTTYGRYSIRFRADNLPGYKTAWLLWPDSDVWPAHGEIDFPEGNLGAGDRIHAFAHHASSRGGQDAFPTNATFAAWHTVTVEWVPGKVTFLLDGKVIGVSTTMVPSKAMHWVLQTETNHHGTVPSALVKGHVLVDWVSFWTRG
jgi:beta-glucanase (GH16 family)